MLIPVVWLVPWSIRQILVRFVLNSKSEIEGMEETAGKIGSRRFPCGLEFLAMDMRDLVGGTVGVDMRSHRVSLSDEAWGLGGDGDLKVWQMAWEWKPKKGQVIDCSKLIR
jgi:hypothetical protein